MRWIWFVALGGCATISQEDVDRKLAELCDVENPPEGCPAATDPASILEVDCYGDLDGDGFGFGEATVREDACNDDEVDNGDDCDDANPNVNPDAVEVCDGIDNDCNALEDDGLEERIFYADADGDGHGDPDGSTLTTCQTTVEGFASVADDCDDGDDDAYPGNTEACDGIDNDCNGLDDDGLPFTDWFLDGDGDGHGDAEIITTTCSGVAPSGHVASDDDCDDDEAASYPGNPEICDDLDNDCANGVDDGLVFATWYVDADSDGLGDPDMPVESCLAAPAGRVENDDDCDDSQDSIGAALEYWPDVDVDGYGDPDGPSVFACIQPDAHAPNAGDCDDDESLAYPGNGETCDGIDNDCENGIDDGFELLNYWPDGDTDGYGDSEAIAVQACAAPEGHVPNDTDCRDDVFEANPGIPDDDDCDGIDDNCSGAVDEGATYVDYWPDNDGDTYGDRDATPVSTCDGAPTDHVADATDCDDTDLDVNMGSSDDEVVGYDVDCDGTVLCHVDLDGDGFGSNDLFTPDYDPDDGCDVAGGALLAGDCSDDPATDPLASSINPEGSDTPGDLLDQDCDGNLTCYADLDRDGFGDDNASNTREVPATAGTCDDLTRQAASMQGDCDDTDTAIHPGDDNPDLTGDPTDRDCDGFITCFEDVDGDTFGSDVLRRLSAATHDSCDSTGSASRNGDCLDDSSDPYADEVNPDRVEVPANTYDEDCDGSIECYADADFDGYGSEDAFATVSASGGIGSCDDASNGVSLTDDDCDDADPETHPGAVEVCDGADNDCLASTPDDGLVTVIQSDGVRRNWPIGFAMSRADTGETVNICSQTDAYEVSLTRAEDVTVHGIDVGHGPPHLTASSFDKQVLQVTGGTLTMDNVILEGAGLNPNDGGCVQVLNGATLELFQSEVYGCQSLTKGGAFFVSASTLELDEVWMQGNSAVEGGVVWAEGSRIEADNSVFTQNDATDRGGAVFASGGALDLLNTEVELNGNSAMANGGAVFAVGLDHLYTGETHFRDNRALQGGGLFVADLGSDDAKIEGGTHTGNEANEGGFLFLRDSRSANTLFLTVSGVQIGSNSAQTGGGLALRGSGKLNLEGSEASANTASINGAFARVTDRGQLRLAGSIVTRHTGVPALDVSSSPTPSVLLNTGASLTQNTVGAQISNNGTLRSLVTWVPNSNTRDFLLGAALPTPATAPTSAPFLCDKEACRVE